MFHVLLTLVAVITLGRLLGPVCRRFAQPPMIGEVIAGIVLGPTLLGSDLSERLLPPAAAPQLAAIAQFGVILYLFLVGLEMNPAMLRRRGRAAVVISLTGMALPFALGLLLARGLYDRLAPPGVSELSFALFLGVAMSITAFPVLARILNDLGIARTELGTMALTSAAVGDAAAWCLLALVVGIAQAEPTRALVTLAGTLGFMAVMLFVARPMLAAFVARDTTSVVAPTSIALTLLGLLASALATEAIGIHALFGAFLFGASVQHDSALARALVGRLRDLTTIVLLPAFFALTGLRTELGLVAGSENWLICGLIVLAATAGKVGGTLLAGRATGLNSIDSATLGVLMNTRGLMELIVLNVGLDLGIISPTLFTMLVIMALATTIATSPIVLMLLPRQQTEFQDQSSEVAAVSTATASAH